MEIRIEDVSKKIKGVTVLDHISLKMQSGEIVGLKGVNGSGKTMLMRMASGLILPTAGKVYVDGKELGKEIAFPESMGLLIENPAFLDNYDGFKNLKFLASIKDLITDEEIKASIARAGLDPDSKKKYKKYSLGMKQRLGIAGAIMERSELLILDEPTNALDTQGVEMLKGIVREEKERGALVILSCHDESILEDVADRICYIENGKLVREVSCEKSNYDADGSSGSADCGENLVCE